MRTTIDLPDDLHRVAMSIARDRRESLSVTVADLIRRGLRGGEQRAAELGERNGFPQVSVGRVITTEDVRGLDDE